MATGGMRGGSTWLAERWGRAGDIRTARRAEEGLRGRWGGGYTIGLQACDKHGHQAWAHHTACAGRRRADYCLKHGSNQAQAKNTLQPGRHPVEHKPNPGIEHCGPHPDSHRHRVQDVARGVRQRQGGRVERRRHGRVPELDGRAGRPKREQPHRSALFGIAGDPQKPEVGTPIQQQQTRPFSARSTQDTGKTESTPISTKEASATHRAA